MKSGPLRNGPLSTNDTSQFDDIVALRGALAEAHTRASTMEVRADTATLRAEHAEAELARAKTSLSVKDAEIELLKVEIKKAKRSGRSHSKEGETGPRAQSHAAARALLRTQARRRRGVGAATHMATRYFW